MIRPFMEDVKQVNAVFRWARRHWAWLLIGLSIVLVAVVRVRLLDLPLERDEGEYAYAGQLILQGVPPYKEVYNMKLPGTYAAYAANMALFGQTPAGIHFGLLLVNAASIVLLFLIGRRLVDDVTGAVAAVSFALMSLSESVLGLAGHATHFVTLFALAGILVLLKATEINAEIPHSRDGDGGEHQGTNRGIREIRGRGEILSSCFRVVRVFRGSQFLPSASCLFLSGLLFGLAFLMKQHGVFFGLFGGLWLMWLWIEKRSEARTARPTVFRAARAEPPARRQTLIRQSKTKVTAEYAKHAEEPNRTGRWEGAGEELQPLAFSLQHSLLPFAAGCVLPYALTCLALWAAGVFPQFWFWTVTYAQKYASAVPAGYSAELFRGALRVVSDLNVLLWLLPWAGALMMWWDARLTAARRFFFTALFFCSFASVCVGFYFRPHYFITLLPALGLLSGLAVSRALHALRHDRGLELFLAIAVLALAALAGPASLVSNGAMWFGLTPREASEASYATSMFTDSEKIAAYLKGNSPPDKPIAVIGSEPQICLLAKRKSATGHIYMFPLMENHPFARTMQEQMIAEIQKARPEYFVFVNDHSSWLVRPGSELLLLNWWRAYWPQNLDIVDSVRIRHGNEIRGAEETKTQNAAEEISKDPFEQGERHVIVYRRKR